MRTVKRETRLIGVLSYPNRAVYAREGVSHCWLIDPGARMLEVLQFESGRWSILGTHVGDAVVRVPPFGDIELALRTLWGED